jgi:O-antigen ligase
MLGAIVATQSRSGALGLAAMVLVLGVQVARRRPGLAFAGLLGILLLLPAVPSSYWNRMSSITDASSDDTGSREARSTLLRESFATFLAHPVTGIGAGQFRNYNPDERVQAWRETHNVVLQVAAELGVGGVLVFLFLIGRAAYAPLQTRRLLRRASGGQGKPIGRFESVPAVTQDEHEMLDAHCTAMVASLAGWFVCALFASVAYHWTFYYLLALCSAPRELLADRLDLRQRSRQVSSVRLRTGAAAGVRA